MERLEFCEHIIIIQKNGKIFAIPKDVFCNPAGLVITHENKLWDVTDDEDHPGGYSCDYLIKWTKRLIFCDEDFILVHGKIFDVREFLLNEENIFFADDEKIPKKYFRRFSEWRKKDRLKYKNRSILNEQNYLDDPKNQNVKWKKYKMVVDGENFIINNISISRQKLFSLIKNSFKDISVIGDVKSKYIYIRKRKEVSKEEFRLFPGYIYENYIKNI